jgi:molybdenum cofactor synthesis domain-containing protein
MPHRAEAVVVGEEILSGKIADQNGPYLAKDLRALGVRLERLTIVPDDVERIAEVVRAAAARVDFVVASGGVGPTLDDLTFEGVARAFDKPLVRYADLARVISEFFGASTTDAHLSMADLPEGSELVYSAGLKFPVVKTRNVYVFPGSPEIFRKKWDGLRERFRGPPFFIRRVFTTLEEGVLAPHLDFVKAAAPEVELGSYPVFDAPDYAVQVTLDARDPVIVDRALKILLDRLGPGVVVRTS